MNSSDTSGESGPPISLGTRVRVQRDPAFGPGPWPAEPSGRIAPYPGAANVFTEVKTRFGLERSYWIVFDEPQLDGDGDGPYRGGEVLERYLSPLGHGDTASTG